MLGFHHLRKRARIMKGLEPFPAVGIWKRYFDYLMYGVGIFAPIVLLPQILEIYTTKNSAGLSLLTWSLFILLNILWTIYGLLHKDIHILFANAFMILFNSVVVVGILLYS
ncbi:hypothetical protein A2609_02240 [Candidatus Kaiserbacteria bacterium RIFOXYD1_FULL_47_14]|uniref:Sugar transporter SemiSWEET n=1 Tax=Candidatus Kaiserbacteria bacterium RIFOXYD1_FULL_47_14 TaxID=1798533 RepID=A0A1F6G757_9BACT|nr:MAG: hypothetical protein A2609_02240 [Candidatus Kaiserbacteria bacterium RIFOXYD1_FULL_47_14]